MSTRKKRTIANSTRGASSSLDEELNLSTLLTQGEKLPEPSVAAAKATYEAELAKLRKEAEELAKAKKRLLAVQHEAEAAKEIQRQKAEIAKLQEELRAIKARQSLSFNQPSPEYNVNQSIFIEGNMPFT
jgi:chromosome segregation ATPase